MDQCDSDRARRQASLEAFAGASTGSHMDHGLSDRVLVPPMQSISRRRVIKHRATLPSFHEVPRHNDYGSEQRTTTRTISGRTEAGASSERRTMSVSLPIEEEVIRSVAGRLRQISDDFALQVSHAPH